MPRIPVESVTGSLRLANDADVTMARVMVAMANKASRDTARRVSRARQRQAEEGKWGGGKRPFGFGPDGVTVNPDEAAEIRRAADAILAGVSLRQVTASLRDRGVPTVTGATWDTQTVKDMLLRPRNAGLMVYRAERRPRTARGPPLHRCGRHRRGAMGAAHPRGVVAGGVRHPHRPGPPERPREHAPLAGQPDLPVRDLRQRRDAGGLGQHEPRATATPGTSAARTATWPGPRSRATSTSGRSSAPRLARPDMASVITRPAAADGPDPLELRREATALRERLNEQSPPARPAA